MAGAGAAKAAASKPVKAAAPSPTGTGAAASGGTAPASPTGAQGGGKAPSRPAPVTPTQVYQGVPGDAKGTIVIAVVLTSGSALIAHIAKSKNRLDTEQYVRIILGGFLMGLSLTLLSAVSPKIARALAWLITLSALLINGQVLFGVATTVTATKNIAPSKGTMGLGKSSKTQPWNFGGGSF